MISGYLYFDNCAFFAQPILITSAVRLLPQTASGAIRCDLVLQMRGIRRSSPGRFDPYGRPEPLTTVSQRRSEEHQRLTRRLKSFTSTAVTSHASAASKSSPSSSSLSLPFNTDRKLEPYLKLEIQHQQQEHHQHRQMCRHRKSQPRS